MQLTAANALEGGFGDYVFQSQSTFRALMDAMARPGTLRQVAEGVTPPFPLSPVAAAVALTLCDFDTPVWLDGPLSASAEVGAWLAIQTGSPIVSHPAQAAFAFIADSRSMPDLIDFAQGTQEYPDRSTTLVLQVASMDRSLPLELTGPGIETTTTVAPGPLPSGFADQLAANRARSPRGVDIILAGPGGILCLPRSTVVREL